MILIKNNQIDFIYHEAIKILVEKDCQPINKNISKEDVAVIIIPEYISNGRVIVKYTHIENNFNYNNFFKNGNQMANEECQYWFDEFFRSGRLKTLVNHLKDNPSSKRAITLNWKEEFLDLSKKSACQTYAYFRVKGKYLEMHSHMRAEDALNCHLLDLEILNEIHLFLCKELKYEKGYFYHFVDSLHIYSKDLEEAQYLKDKGVL